MEQTASRNADFASGASGGGSSRSDALRGSAFRAEDRVGLIAAIVLHAMLGVMLVMQVFFAPDPVPQQERVTVSIASEVSLNSTAPDPVSESRAATAPTISEDPAPATSDDAAPVPDEITAAPAPATPTARNTPRPSPRTTPRTPARNRDRSRPDRTPRPRATPTPTPAPAPRRSGGSRIGEDFLPGNGSSATSRETRLPASQVGRSARASITSQMLRELSPHWRGKAPSGADAELLVTVVAFELNPDGSLKGSPRVVRQTGVTPSNDSQKARHAEVALRAVRLAAPFDLPEEYYNAWKSVRALSFDRNFGR